MTTLHYPRRAHSSGMKQYCATRVDEVGALSEVSDVVSGALQLIYSAGGGF